MTTASPTLTEDRALELLGQGIGPEMVASAIGVSVSRISQLLSDTEFAAQVAERRFHNLVKHNDRDSKYDLMEDALLERMKDCMVFMTRPMEIARVLQIINQAKRRGASSSESITAQASVVNLVMPINVYQKFTVNTHNQVIQAGQQQLITVQSGQMSGLLDAARKSQPVITHEQHHSSNAAGPG